MNSQCTKLQRLRSRAVVFARAHKRRKRCTHSCWALLTVHRRADKHQHKKEEKMSEDHQENLVRERRARARQRLCFARSMGP